MLQTGLKPMEGSLYTEGFRVQGVFYLRNNTGTAWLLNADDRPHLPLTRVRMYRPGTEHPPADENLLYDTHFAAIPKSSIVWMVGGAPDQTQEGYGRQPRKIFLVFPTYLMSGYLSIRPEVRLSDFLASAMSNKPFYTLNDARILSPGTPGKTLSELEELQSHPFVVVNLRSVAGVFDPQGGDPGKAFVVEDD